MQLPTCPSFRTVLSIFDLDVLYGSVDGQKLGVERPTVKARHSRKCFGRGKGVVGYTLLCNHVPLHLGERTQLLSWEYSYPIGDQISAKLKGNPDFVPYPLSVDMPFTISSG
jgi:hypothetical protein